MRRPFALFMAAAVMLGPAGSWAAVIPTINVAPAALQVKVAHQIPVTGATCSDRVDPPTGMLIFAGNRTCKSDPGGSPAIMAAPVFNGKSDITTVWGKGWSSDLDQFITPTGDSHITWSDGSGAQLNFFNTKASTPSASPVYTTPVNSYITMTAVAASNGIPTSVLERESDGTTRLFSVFESTSILRLSTLTDRNGNTVVGTRDGQGRLTQVTDVHGRYFQMTYDAAGFVSTLSDSAGRSTAFTYDGQGRKTVENGPVGLFSYTYDGQNRLTKIVYPNLGEKNYTYDSQNRALTEDDGGGENLLTYAYFPSSTTVTDSLGHVTVYEFIAKQGLKKVSAITDPANHTSNFTYDSNLNLLSATDELGRVSRFSHDANGNVTAVQDPAGGTTAIGYEPNFNQPISVTDPLGRTTRLSYDSKGNLIQVRDPLSNSAYMSYDGTIGHVVRYQDPLGHPTSLTYTAGNGAVASVTDALNHTAAMQTDALSRVTQYTDPLANVTQFTYDDTDLTSVIDALGHHTDFGYAPGRNGRFLKTVTDANSHTTTLDYDGVGRVTEVDDQLGHATQISYDTASRPTSITTRKGQPIALGYDSRDRLTTLTLPEGTVNLGYDDAGNLTSADSYNGSAVALTRDDLDRVTQVVQTLPNAYQVTLGYAYDANGNRTKMTTPWGDFTYAYDQLDRVTKITNPYGQNVTFTYDALSRRTGMVYPNGVAAVYAYDAAGRISQIVHQKAGAASPVAFSNYTYDADGNRTSVTDAEGTHSYAYDALNRLTSAVHPPTSVLPVKSEVFTYDAVGNRTADAERTAYAYDAANRIVSDSSFTYTADLNGNLTSSTETATGVVRTYLYDSSNRLIEVDSSTGALATYKYGPSGNRVERNFGATTYRYIYDGNQLLAILDGSNALMALFTNGPGIDAPLIARKGGTDYYYHADALGSIVALTDGSGATLETYEYEAFGKTAVKDAQGGLHDQSTVGNPFMYTSREYDTESRLYYLRARHLDAETGRFFQEDPISSINQFAYVLNNPIIATDPLGLSLVIYIGGPNLDTVYGHAAIGISDPTGTSVYSYGTGDPWGVSEDRYLAGQAHKRTTVAYTLNTTPEQDLAVLTYLKTITSRPMGEFKPFGHNCSNFTLDALKAARINLNIPLIPTTPYTLDAALSVYLVRHPELGPSIRIFQRQ